MTNSNAESPLLTMKDAAEVAGLDYRTIKAGVDRGTIPSIDFGPRKYIPRVAFMHLLETGEAHGQD